MATRPVQWLAAPDGEPLFGARGFRVSICDEGGGEFVTIESASDDEVAQLRIDPEEWPALRDAMEAAVAGCRRDEADGGKEEDGR